MNGIGVKQFHVDEFLPTRNCVTGQSFGTNFQNDADQAELVTPFYNPVSPVARGVVCKMRPADSSR